MALHKFLAWFRRLGVVPLFAWLVFLSTGAPARAAIVLSDYRPTHPLKIMAIGDSITDDCSINGAWRLYLQPMLEANGYPFLFLGRQISAPVGSFTKRQHEGYCGALIAAPGMMDTIVHGYDGTNVYLLKTIADTLTNRSLIPDLVLVAMGANDIGRGRNPYRVATNDMPLLLDLIWSNAPNAHIILTKTTTLSNAVIGYMTNAGNVPIYNTTLQEMVKARRAAGQNLFLADMFSTVDYSTMFQSDHLHPNALGLNAMAKEFFTRIQTITIRTNPIITSLIPSGADWAYSDTGQDLGTNWTRQDYDDSSWSRGPARLGYNDPAVITTVGVGPDPANKNPTTYFRRTFVVPEDTIFTNLNLRLSRMDGAVVWLNGQEAFRTNMPAGPISFTNLASRAVTGEAAYILYPTNLAVASLPAGTNVVAVEVHMSSPLNLRLGFDLELIGKGFVPPPPSVAAVLSSDNIQLSWPATNRGAYVLHTTTDLSGSGAWVPAAAPVQTNADQCVVELPLESNQRFFRLQKLNP